MKFSEFNSSHRFADDEVFVAGYTISEKCRASYLHSGNQRLMVALVFTGSFHGLVCSLFFPQKTILVKGEQAA